MTNANGKTVVIGLELGDGPLVQAWARAGRLPTLKRLMDQGCWGWLETTAEQLHISAWPCIYTGTPPGDHGVYFTFQPAPGLQGYQRFHPGLYGRPTFWQVLDKAGRSCAVLDAPYTHPESGYGGAFIYDWGTWAHYLKPGSVPADLLRRLETACGSYPLGSEANDLGFAPLDPAETAGRLVESVKAKADAVRWLMREQPSELLFTVFGETHVAGHYCWSDELASDAGRSRTSPMLVVYEALDRAINDICLAAGADATVIVISGDSVGPNHAGWHLLPELLARLGYLATPQAHGPEQTATVVTPKFDPVKALRDMLPKDLRQKIARMLPTKLRDKLAQRVDTADIDWSRTRAYWLPTDLEGYVRVNLRGREPQGVVEPGAEFERVLTDLEADLTALRDGKSGHPIVREVIRTASEFPGERGGFLPDLIVRWDPAAPIMSAMSPKIGTVTSESPDSRPGTHRGPGFVIAQGPGIPVGSVLSGSHILDFAPTLLRRLGVAVPKQMHGQVWPELTAD